MKIKYNISVLTPAGWRGVEITALAEKISDAMLMVKEVIFIDYEIPAHDASRTGAKRQQYNALYFAQKQIGCKKRVSSVNILETK
jgi:hypothetical protein